MVNINVIVAQALRIPVADVTNETSMESNSAWDSLSHMDIISTLEVELKMEFSGDEIVEMTSVSKINEIISKRLR